MINKRKILERLLRAMSGAVLRKYRPLVVGITGSVGKSSAKEAVTLVLGIEYDVRGAEGNYNNEIGIPLTIIGAKGAGNSLIGWLGVFVKWLRLMFFRSRYPEALILEMGIDRPGDMDYLLSFVPLNVGIVTQISSSHTEFFGSEANIAKEKGKLVASLPEDGIVILNGDDERVRKMRTRTKAKTYTYGFGASNDIRAENLLFHRDAKRLEGMSFKLNYDGKSIPVRLPKIVAPHHIQAALAAAALGIAQKINMVEIASVLERFESLPGRLKLLPGRDGAILLDDTYNASPASTLAALDVMKNLMAPRKIVVLGDMLELGADARRRHEELAEAVKAAGAPVAILVGEYMRALYERLLEAGFSRKQAYWFPDPYSAAQAVSDLMRRDDLVLIKGSRSMRMEKVVEALLIDSKDAPALLCCQSKAWREKPFTPPAEWSVKHELEM